VSSILRRQITSFDGGDDLDGRVAEDFLDALIGETDEPLLASVFRSWHRKSISEDEVYSIARVMRDRCTRISTFHETFVDVVGTGGSKVKTFNVSTAAAFVTAGTGTPVAKHGNRAATSNSGSADVLAELGVEPAVDPATAERCLNEIGVCFMFAPNFHRLSPTLARVRRGLGFPTIFNCVGPLCNPASAPHQVIGVWSKEIASTMANALARLGTTRSWIVHGSDGLDEISMSGSTFVAEVNLDSVRTFEVDPGDFGFSPKPSDGIRAASAGDSAEMIRGVLDGRAADQPAERIVAMNAAAALVVSGRCDGMDNAAQMAIESIRSGRASAKLSELTEMSKAR
jgi:anthranilate phosphoribosyltransferase